MLFAGIPVRDHATAVRWYERFFGRSASFEPHATESVWELAENRSVYVVENPAHAGHAMHTVLIDDLEVTVSGLAERGIQPAGQETYEGIRKVIYRDPDGNEFGYAGPVPAG